MRCQTRNADHHQPRQGFHCRPMGRAIMECRNAAEHTVAFRSARTGSRQIGSTRVSDLVNIAVAAKQMALLAAARMPGFRASKSGRATIQMPTKPITAANTRNPGQSFAKKQRRKQQHPKRRCELQRENLRQRDHRQRPEPQVLAGKVKQVAHQMFGQTPWSAPDANGPTGLATAARWQSRPWSATS